MPALESHPWSSGFTWTDHAGPSSTLTPEQVAAFDRVPFEFAAAEGEGFTSVEDWQTGHRAFYAELGHEVRADEPVVCAWFQVIERLDPT